MDLIQQFVIKIKIKINFSRYMYSKFSKFFKIIFPASPSNQSLAPDRDDIYHVRLPTGNTPKTKAIMKKHDMLRTAG